MKLLQLEYHDQSRHWRISPITFQKFTLLVGASGVGKTKILKAILDLKDIAKGKSVNGLKWKVKFSAANNDVYSWEGEFEERPNKTKNILSDYLMEKGDEEKNVSEVVYEKLLLNDSEIVSRNKDKIIFNGKETVKLSRKKSVVDLLKEEEQISGAYQSLQRIAHYDKQSKNTFYFDSILKKADEYKTLAEIRENDETFRIKLYLASINAKKVFNEIKNIFIDIFPYVEDLKAEPIASGELPVFINDVPFIQIKEKGVNEWIGEEYISSGMLRTLYHISELYLCADKTLILVDELENSLGINCIEEVTSQLLFDERDLQFIITSHHPYIINNIDYSKWKIITRKAGVVSAREAKDFKLGKSRHEAFIQLINLDAYSEGVES